jgi:hypothetical protein
LGLRGLKHSLDYHFGTGDNQMAKVNFERFTNFNRTQSELEHLLFFSIAVAGKNASITSRAVNKFFEGVNLDVITPYGYLGMLSDMGQLRSMLERARLGKYEAITKSTEHILSTELHKRLSTCSLEELVAVPYCGLKTARMILLHSRPKMRILPLDTHILKFAAQELEMSVPKSTPGSKINPQPYLKIEGEILSYFDYLARGQRPDSYIFNNGTEMPLKYHDDGSPDFAHLDLSIWLHYRVDTKERTKNAV